MHNTLSLLFIFLATNGFAQFEMTAHHFAKDTSRTVFINAGGNYFFASDAVTNEFAYHYYQRKFITDEIKDNVTKNLSSGNQLAGEGNMELSVIFRPDTSNRKVQAFIGYRNRFFVNIDFPEDFFELYFRGNKNYAGKTADLSGFRYQSFSYHQFVFGIGKSFFVSGNNKLFAGFDIAINNGVRFLNIEIPDMSLYTHPEGEYLDVVLNGTIQSDDSASQHPSRLDGSGYSGDFYLELETENSNLKFSLENFGYIQWNKWSTEVRIDSIFSFDGIDVSDLFDLNDSVRSNISIDSSFYQNFIDDRSEKKILSRLPMKISGSYSRMFCENRLSLAAGVDYILYTKSLPRYFAYAHYQLHRSNHLGLLLAYGGFTGFHGGLCYTHIFPWHLSIRVGSNYLFPMLNYREGKSQGAYLSLSKSF